MHGLCVRVCMLCLNRITVRDELDRSTLDLDSRQKRQINVSVTEMNSTAQYRSVRSTRTRIACMNIECMPACYIIPLASFIYTWDYVSQKNA